MTLVWSETDSMAWIVVRLAIFGSLIGLFLLACLLGVYETAHGMALLVMLISCLIWLFASVKSLISIIRNKTKIVIYKTRFNFLKSPRSIFDLNLYSLRLDLLFNAFLLICIGIVFFEGYYEYARQYFLRPSYEDTARIADIILLGIGTLGFFWLWLSETLKIRKIVRDKLNNYTNK
ncbi:MAG: hypothetical protein LBK70_00095 [Clostridiales bacterium]|jgi:hypothetical protein|nr:hypothetical protein [Clostridiales bacterium]